MSKARESIVSTRVTTVSKWQDFAILIKFRLTSLVVLSALLAYLIVEDEGFTLLSFLVLAIGGFSITAAANALNQALEKDYDRYMKRTQNRPVAAGRMPVSEAIMIGGVLFVAGIILLAFFNPLAAVLGATAVVSYAFLYTPLKRISPMSVFVGAVPGALPTMIAVVAVEGTITQMAFVLFGIQFFWQFAHFWSIGFLGYDDYKKAGFRLVPEQNGKVHPNLGLQSMIFSLLLLPLVLAPVAMGEITPWAGVLAAILSLIYAAYGWNLQKKKDAQAARKLMFFSFIYLPLVLLIFYVGNM